jgi:serine/threonine protein kinase
MALPARSVAVDSARCRSAFRGQDQAAPQDIGAAVLFWLPVPATSRFSCKKTDWAAIAPGLRLAGKWHGFTVGKYKVMERLGRGGLGNVNLCEHQFTQQRMAVKVLRGA